MRTLDEIEDDQASRKRWNSVHKARHPGALSGSDPLEVLSHHRISNLIHRGLTVLDIGVGLGGMSSYLYSRGCLVDALDVSDVAAKTVEPYINHFYLAEKIEDLPDNYYELAISMIVAQHMNERNLRDQIRNVYRALKPGGLFSLHLAGATEPEKNNLTGPIPQGMDGAMCRTPKYAIAMILEETSKATVTLVNNRMEWSRFKSYWYFVHILKGASND